MLPRLLAVTIVLAALATPPAAAQPSADGAASEVQFDLYHNGRGFGTERFSVESRGDTLELRGTLLLKDPAPRRLDARTRLVGEDERLLDYLLATETGDSIGLRVDPDSLRFFTVSAGQRRERTLAPDARRLQVLDNAVASHLWLLARQLARDPAAATPLLAAVPQQLWAGDLQRQAPQAMTGELDGQPLAVERHPLTLAGVLMFMDVDAEGRLLGLSVPIQNFGLHRPGYVGAPLAAAPAATGPSFPTEALSIAGGGPALPALLTLPAATGGPWPACILLHGSGPVDKDMTIGPNRLFAQLANGLAERGIATLRYDKRTFVISKGTPEQKRFGPAVVTLQEEVLDDALAAWKLLAVDDRLDPQRLFILGHSLGAGATPILAGQIAAAGERRPAGLLLLAPPGRDLLSIMLDQFRYLNRQGALGAVELAQAERDAQRLREGSVGAEEMVFFAKPKYWESVNAWQPWGDYAAQPAPALILFGERDYQITAPDRATWQATLDAAPREGAALELLPGLNHLFLRGEGPSGPAEFGLPGALEPALLDRLAAWIKATAPAAD